MWYSKNMAGFGVGYADLMEMRAKKVADQFWWSRVFQKCKF